MPVKLTQEEYIKRAIVVHNNKYSYDKAIYKDARSKIVIICPIHGEFEQRAFNHLDGRGCQLCGGTRTNVNNFISKAHKVHNNKYDYSKIQYINNRSDIEIICPEHGPFWQRPDNHLRGDGCKECHEYKGEYKIKEYLKSNTIEFYKNYRFEDCRNKNPLPFDFYLPDHNLCIEFDGKQHYKPVDYFGGEKSLKAQKQNDNIKNQYCKDNGIELLRIPYVDINKINDILNSKFGEIK